MEPDLIDRYLNELQRSLAPRRSVRDVLAEVEDHLRESVGQLTTNGVDAATAQRLTLDRFGELPVVARAFATNAGGLAMSTSFTRAAGTFGYVSAALWLIAGVLTGANGLIDPYDEGWLSVGTTVAATLAAAATTVVIAGMLVRSGGIRDVLAGVALALMLLATLFMAVVTWAWVFTALPLAGAAAIAVGRMNSVGLAQPRAHRLLVASWLVGAAVVLFAQTLGLGPQDEYGDSAWAWMLGFAIAVVGFAAGLVGVGGQLRGEQPADVSGVPGPGVSIAS